MFRSCLAAFAACLFAIATPGHAGLFGEGPKKQVDYAPASALVAHGTVQIGTFTYPPAVDGKLKPYQLSNTSLADMMLSRNVADFVRESLFKEFRFVGIETGGGPVLSAEIREFKVDDIADQQQTAEITIHYCVTNAQGTVLYDADKSTKQQLGVGNVNPLDNPMTANFEALIGDPAFIKAIDGEMGAPPPHVEAASGSMTLAYVPSSAFIVGGALAIGRFEYQPAMDNKVDADQIGNTALGNIHLDRPIAAYFAEAILKEFRLTGITVESKDRILSGQIVKLFSDDLGSSATWTLDVKYQVKDGAGNTIYEGEKITTLETQKTLEMLNSLLRRNFESLLLDDAFLKAIGSSANVGNVAETVVPSDGWNWVHWSGYGPRSALVAHGSVWVGPFTYPVATADMKPTEIPNTALMTTIHADKPVAELMHDLTLNELRFTGIDVRGSDRTLTAEIEKYKVDDISNPAEWTIAVHFAVRDKTGALLYDAVKSAAPTNGKFVINFLEMKLVIEDLISDPAFIKAIN